MGDDAVQPPVADVCYYENAKMFNFYTDKDYYMPITISSSDILEFIVNLRLYLTGHAKTITLNMYDLTITLAGDTVEYYYTSINPCTHDSRPVKFKCNLKQLNIEFTKLYRDACNRLYYTPIYKIHCGKWFLWYSTFINRLTKAIDENPTRGPITILHKM